VLVILRRIARLLRHSDTSGAISRAISRAIGGPTPRS